ncbi:hypothetical protein F4561_001582 [Lipingzhangella halophila]|uniref:Uncharacterized protein n=1 Tax=Lipingzhangella halophila TaxID=1783352 RepID=A0A7W7W1B0_9ACTN|nr:hypothetical protein [Lipingzhangella halophila]MBB4930762.1 hypothetical protein [Lipingzhangella halophila]
MARWLDEVDHGLAAMRGDPDGRDTQAWIRSAATAPTERGWPPRTSGTRHS